MKNNNHNTFINKHKPLYILSKNNSIGRMISFITNIIFVYKSKYY